MLYFAESFKAKQKKCRIVVRRFRPGKKKHEQCNELTLI